MAWVVGMLSMYRDVDLSGCQDRGRKKTAGAHHRNIPSPVRMASIMGFYVSIDSSVVPAPEARVSVLDNGFTFGDSVYETLRTYEGRPFALDRHLGRLRASAARLAIELPLRDAELKARLDAVLQAARNAESYIRFIVTRGVGDLSYHFERVKGPTVVIVVKPYEFPDERVYRDGIPVCLVSVQRNHKSALDPAIKSCNLLNSILAIREAQSKGAAEALMLNAEGRLAEGASSNVFIVKNGIVLTPPLDAGILAGITREVILELLPSLSIEGKEVTLGPEDLRGADEAFISSSLREAAPIATVDGRPLATGRPGPVTLRILEAFRKAAPGHSH
jgi:branched-chain amino acid aminotransferase